MNHLATEAAVCRCVNTVIRSGIEASPSNLYDYPTKPPLCISVARQFVFFVFHDYYHIPYSRIATRAHRSVRSVISGAGKARGLSMIDDVYRTIREEINQELYR